MREGTENAWILITMKSIKIISKFNSSVAIKGIMGKKNFLAFKIGEILDLQSKREQVCVCVCVCVCVNKEC